MGGGAHTSFKYFAAACAACFAVTFGSDAIVGITGSSYPTNFLAAMLALWPPKPNELLMTAVMFSSRAVLGT